MDTRDQYSYRNTINPMAPHYLTYGSHHYALVRANHFITMTKFDPTPERQCVMFHLYRWSTTVHVTISRGWSLIHSMCVDQEEQFPAARKAMAKVAMIDAMTDVL